MVQLVVAPPCPAAVICLRFRFLTNQLITITTEFCKLNCVSFFTSPPRSCDPHTTTFITTQHRTVQGPPLSEQNVHLTYYSLLLFFHTAKMKSRLTKAFLQGALSARWLTIISRKLLVSPPESKIPIFHVPHHSTSPNQQRNTRYSRPTNNHFLHYKSLLTNTKRTTTQRLITTTSSTRS